MITPFPKKRVRVANLDKQDEMPSVDSRYSDARRVGATGILRDFVKAGHGYRFWWYMVHDPVPGQKVEVVAAYHVLELKD